MGCDNCSVCDFSTPSMDAEFIYPFYWICHSCLSNLIDDGNIVKVGKDKYKIVKPFLVVHSVVKIMCRLP